MEAAILGKLPYHGEVRRMAVESLLHCRLCGILRGLWVVWTRRTWGSHTTRRGAILGKLPDFVTWPPWCQELCPHCAAPLATYTCTVSPPCLLSNPIWNEAAAQEDVIPRGGQTDKVPNSTILLNCLWLFAAVGCNRNNNTIAHRHLSLQFLGNTPSKQNHHDAPCFFRYN